MSEAVDRRFERWQYAFTAREALDAAVETSFWWRGAHAYAEHLKIAKFHCGDVERARRPYLERARADVARLTPKPQFRLFGQRSAAPDAALAKAIQTLEEQEARQAQFLRQKSDIDRFIAEVDAFAAGRDPYMRMAASEVERFKQLFARGRAEFEDIVRFRTPSRIDDITTETLLAMATGDETAFAAMPPTVRDLINARHLLPTSGWHQMFGLGVDIQGTAIYENEGKHLLLQLVYDTMIDWRFGDVGAYQFWISDKDLVARNWDAVTLTFECH